jgi:hypothetical protein
MSDFLKTNSKFLEGAGSVFNLFGNYYDTPVKSDYEASCSDWKAVEEDFKVTLAEYEKK